MTTFSVLLMVVVITYIPASICRPSKLTKGVENATPGAPWNYDETEWEKMTANNR